MVPSTTLLYGGLFGVWLTALGLVVSSGRGAEKAGVGVEPSPVLQRRIRGHANAAEWGPFGVLLLLVLELGGLGSTALHVLGGAFLVGRFLHGAGMLVPRRNPLSTVGAMVNYLVTLTMSGWAVWLHLAR